MTCYNVYEIGDGTLGAVVSTGYYTKQQAIIISCLVYILGYSCVEDLIGVVLSLFDCYSFFIKLNIYVKMVC